MRNWGRCYGVCSALIQREIALNIEVLVSDLCDTKLPSPYCLRNKLTKTMLLIGRRVPTNGEHPRGGLLVKS